MARPTGNQESDSEEFQQLVCQIGGKERIYLVSDVCRTDGEDEEPGILQEFVHDMFSSSLNKTSNGEVHPALRDTNCLCTADSDSVTPPRENETPMSEKPKDLGSRAEPAVGEDKSAQGVQRTRTSTINTRGSERTIDSPMIIFIFSQDFVREGSNNEMCLKEILKDVRARTRRGGSAWPALIGLIGSGQESPESLQSVRLLESALRSVFRTHAQEAIWVGHFIPKTHEGMVAIKRHACRALYSSQTSGPSEASGSLLGFWPFPCLPRPHRRGPPGQAHGTLGDAGRLEEGIPLKTKVLSSGAHTDCGTVWKNGHQP